MTTHRSRIAGLPALADQVARLAPQALRRIVALEDEHDGFPTRGEGVGRGSSEDTPVERAALGGRLPLTRDREAILGAVDEIERLALHVVKLSTRYLDRIDAATMRCSGGAGLEGSLEWGRADCHEIQEEGRREGLCMACRKRRDRWRAERSRKVA
jgi:hypothetical protein